MWSYPDPGGFAPAAPPRLRSRGPIAPLRSGGRAARASPVVRLEESRVQVLVSSRITGYVISRLASTIAPIMATRSSIDATSNGIR